MRKNRMLCGLLAALASIAGISLLCGCGESSSSSAELPEEKSEYLLSGFDSIDDLYAIKPIGVMPTDDFVLDFNTYKNYVKEGAGSLVYENVQGAYHEAFMLFENSSAPEINAQKISSVCVDVFNPNDTVVNFALLMKTYDGATLFVEQAELAVGEWTTVSIDLTGYSYKQKAFIEGFSLRFDVDFSAMFYVDNAVAKMGAADLPPVDVNAELSVLSTPEGVEKITQENFDDHVAFVEKVFYLQNLYQEMEDKTAVSNENLAKLNACLAMVEDLDVLYDSRTQFITKGFYGNALTVLSGEDERYGGVWLVNVPKTGYEQGVSHSAISVDGYGKVVYWLYNPMDVNLTAAFHGGWYSWNLKKVFLPAKEWTKIELNARWFEYGFVGQVFFILYGAETIEGEFKMTSFYGISAEVIAQPVIDMIAALPALDDLTSDDASAIMNAKAAYADLSSSAKAAVTNVDKLNDSETKIYEIEANPVIAMIDALPTVENLTTEDREAVVAARTAYYALSNEAKAQISEERTEKLNACYTLIVAVVVEGKINALPSAEELSKTDGEKYIYLIHEAQAEYEALSETDKANISADAVAKLQELVSLTKEYKILFKAGVNTLTKDGNGSDWTGSITTEFDDTYGETYILDVQSQSSNNFDFHANGMDTKGLYRVFFYVYNPSDQNYPMVAYTADWLTSQTVNLIAGEWTKVEIPVESFYKKGGVFYVVVTGREIVSGWKVSSFYGSVNEAPEIPENPDTPTGSVLLDASDETLLLSGRDTGNGGTVGTAVDETYGNVWTINVTSGSQSDFHAKSLDIQDYKYVMFYIYNPASVDVALVCYKSDWSGVSTTMMKASAWTAISIDTSVSGSDFFFILNTNVTDGEWKVTSFIGANEPFVPETPTDPASNVLLDASDATLLLSGRDTGNKGTVGTAVDETYGNVWTLDVTRDSYTKGQGDFHAKSLDVQDYKYVTFYIYNPTETDVWLVCYQASWTNAGNTLMQAKSWTAVTVEIEKATSNFFFIINSNVTEGTWKITSYIGVNEI